MISLNGSDNFVEFSSLEEKFGKLREWELVGIRDYKKAINGEVTEIKPIMYKGIFVNSETPCDVVGYATQKTKYGMHEIAVILINGETNKINPAYLKQMQNKDFSVYGSTEE